MIHLPGSRVDIGSETDWEGCKLVYLALREAENKKREEEERLKKISEGTDMDLNTTNGSTSSTGSKADQLDSMGKEMAGKGKKKMSTPGGDTSVTSSGGYAGPVTRQRQRQTQSGGSAT